MDIITNLRLGYLGASLLVLVVALIPAFRYRFLAYGARTSTSAKDGQAKTAKSKQDGVSLSTLLDRLADITVPHSWFTSFYVVCVGWCLIWATQLITAGPLFRLVASATLPGENTMTFRQVVVAWAMLLVQGSRRLYESLEFARPSKSRMWFVHWLLGIAFYTATSMAVWVEGISAIRANTFDLKSLAVTAPDVRTFAGTLLFILASGAQHDCHAYLASLKPKTPVPAGEEEGKKDHYKLPEHPAFSRLIAPHYTAECLIYIALTLVATPQSAWMNGTLACALVFVVVNLGATADVTKGWYEERFGPEAVKGKWRMLPFVF